MASWRPYIDAGVNSGNCQGLSMHDLKGNPFVSSDGFKAVAVEVGTITKHFVNPRALDGLPLKVSGREYYFHSGEANKEIILRQGDAGVVLFKCGAYVVVGRHDERTSVNKCRSAVEKIIFYLKQASEQGSGSSWQPYIDHAVTSWMVVKAGGIYAYPSGEKWACSRGFGAKPSQVRDIAEYFDDPEALAGRVLEVGGRDYMCVAGELNKEIYLQQGGDGIVFRLCGNNITGKFVAVAYHDGTVEPIAARLALVKVAEYFDARGKGG